MSEFSIIKEVMRLEYRRRLQEVLGEVDVFDDRGKMIISPGLKVRHKDSGYEYTVDRVEGDAESLRIVLLDPGEPRFDPPPEEDKLLVNSLKEADEDDTPIVYDEYNGQDIKEFEEEMKNIDEFIIDEEEFQKDYEVK